MKYFEITLKSKHSTEIIKTKNCKILRNRNMKNQNPERQKPSFTKKNR